MTFLPNPDRFRIKRKWSADKFGGPTLLGAELLTKRLIQHSWACATKTSAIGVLIVPALRRPDLSSSFYEVAETALRVLCDDLGIAAYLEPWLDGRLIFRLDGVHHINSRGELRRGKPKVPKDVRFLSTLPKCSCNGP